MGNGQEVVAAYMGMREGVPCPTMQRDVGVGRARSAEGVMDEERVRRYSWQFCISPRQLCIW